MKIVFSDAYYQVYAGDPAASAGRMEAIMKILETAVEVGQAIPATEEQIAAVHTRSHIKRAKGQKVYEVTALAAGGAILAA